VTAGGTPPDRHYSVAVHPVVMVGFIPFALMDVPFQPGGPILIIEEPDVVRKREVWAKMADAEVACELVEWPYQLPGAADEFFNAHPELHPAAVTPMGEYGTPFAARLAERYGLPGAGFGAALLLRDKALLRKVTSAAGIANPEWATVTAPGEVRDFMAAHPGPVVLKPANRQGSVGTKVLHGADEVDRAWAECLVHDEGVMVPDRPMPLHMLVERYVNGREFSVETLFDRGRPVFANVTGKLLFPGPRPIELGHEVPADIPAELTERLCGLTERVLHAVGFGTGIVHCEWIVADEAIYLVECAGRMAGDGIVMMIEAAYPVELIRSFWTLMKGEPLPAPLPRSAEQGAAVRFLHTEPGAVLSVDGLDDARAVPGVTWCSVGVQPGDTVRELRSSWDRVGSAMAVAPTAAEAMACAAAALDRIQVKVRQA
jgi:biotin carboxylase